MLQNLTLIYINIKEVSHHNGLSISILQTAPPQKTQSFKLSNKFTKYSILYKKVYHMI